MCVITRFQTNAALYSSVFENPLILKNIFQHIDAKDSLNLSITNAPFTKDKRFIDTLDIFVDQKKTIYCQDVIDYLSIEFCKTMNSNVMLFLQIKESGGSIDERIIQIQVVYDHINDNKWILGINPNLKNMAENMLLKNIHSIHFVLYILFYLEQIFQISLQFELDDDDEVVKFIISTAGDKIFLHNI